MTFSVPLPKPSVAADALVRPDWTLAERRDPRKLWLDKNENVDPELAAVVKDVMKSMPPEIHWTYPDSAGLYRKLAAQIGVNANNLILAAGSDGIIRSVFEAYVSVDDVVMHTNPTFAMYSVYSQMYGARTIAVDYEETQSGPRLPRAQMISTIKETSPRVVCLPNPDSPTGTVIEHAALRDLLDAAGRAGSVVLIDEAYYPFHRDTVQDWIADYPHLIVARSTGKAWGMAGLRIGYGIAHPEVAIALHKVRPMYEVSTVASWTFDRMLDHHASVLASVDRLNEGKRQFLTAMDEIGFRTLKGAGNFLHVGFGDRGAAIHAALEELVYYRRDFSHPSLAGFSRFSAATVAQFAPIIERIRSVALRSEGK